MDEEEAGGCLFITLIIGFAIYLGVYIYHSYMLAHGH